jgi:hypothetical protein
MGEGGEDLFSNGGSKASRDRHSASRIKKENIYRHYRKGDILNALTLQLLKLKCNNITTSNVKCNNIITSNVKCTYITTFNVKMP